MTLCQTRKIALVTGAGQGIGRAIAIRLADDGLDVALNDIHAKKDLLEVLSNEIRTKGCRSCVICADVSVEEEVQEMIDTVVQELGGLDVMVANAGIFKTGSLIETSVEHWDTTFGVNVKGTFLCYKYAATQMIRQGRGGRIIGPSSKNGKRGMPDGIAYSSTKFAIRGLTQVAALELGRHGITVNTYAPGAIDTPMMQKTRAERAMYPHISRDRPARVPPAVGYDGKPEDVASIVSYLASEEAHYVTGQSITLDGGIVFE
ncbi:NAD(P)-binding protein [Gyrodon lividus]|nr:NAD(P)-binding protein [Gyrodon lividus]